MDGVFALPHVAVPSIAATTATNAPTTRNIDVPRVPSVLTFHSCQHESIECTEVGAVVGCVEGARVDWGREQAGRAVCKASDVRRRDAAFGHVGESHGIPVLGGVGVH